MRHIAIILAAITLYAGDVRASGMEANDIVRDPAPIAYLPEHRGNSRRSINLEIRFHTGSARLTAAARTLVDRLAHALRDEQLTGSRFEIAGHTDASGGRALNQRLSARRAESVGRYLVDFHDIDPGRLITVGKGEEALKDPLNPHSSTNRRVEIINLTPIHRIAKPPQGTLAPKANDVLLGKQERTGGVERLNIVTMKDTRAVDMRIFPIVAIAAFLIPAAAAAQSWSNPDRTNYREKPRAEEDTRLRNLTKSLNELLDKGEQQRLADPWFLKDLRDLVNQYHRPWSRMLLSDDFSARGPEPQAPWRVLRGEFRVDWRYGLRSLVVPARRQAAPSSSNEQQGAQGDAVQQLFGALLNQALRGAQQGGQEQSGNTGGRNSGASEIAAPVKISNALAIETEVTAQPLSGNERTRFSLGVYQGHDGAGYRVIFVRRDANSQARIRLLCMNGRGGAATIDEVDGDFRFDPERPTRVTWTRTTSGEMEVTIGEKSLIKVADRGFRDPFDGFLLRNGSGDMALRKIRINGT